MEHHRDRWSLHVAGHLELVCNTRKLTVTASLPDNPLESAYKYLSPRLDPHTAGIASGRRLRRCKKVERFKKCRLGGYGPPRMILSCALPLRSRLRCVNCLVVLIEATCADGCRWNEGKAPAQTPATWSADCTWDHAATEPPKWSNSTCKDWCATYSVALMISPSLESATGNQ